MQKFPLMRTKLPTSRGNNQPGGDSGGFISSLYNENEFPARNPDKAPTNSVATIKISNSVTFFFFHDLPRFFSIMVYFLCSIFLFMIYCALSSARLSK